MYNPIDQKIKAIVLFENGKIIPKVFKWQNREYKIKEIALHYTEKEGDSVIHCFGVETESGSVFKIDFNDKSLVWVLREIWSD